LEGIVFAILAKPLASKLIKGRYDLEDFAVTRNHPRFPKDKYTLLSDNADVATELLADEEVLAALWASTGRAEKDVGADGFSVPLIESIVITDQLKELPAT
jgi:hypothetical protein